MLGGGSSQDPAHLESFKQLSEMVMAFCSTVCSLSDQMSSVQTSVNQLLTKNTINPPSHNSYSESTHRLMIREEVREMRAGKAS